MMNLPKTADDWQLYTCSMKCGTAARSLTAALKRALKTETVAEAQEIWYAVASKFSSYGATDTEPRDVAYTIIDEHFGVESW